MTRSDSKETIRQANTTPEQQNEAKLWFAYIIGDKSLMNFAGKIVFSQ